MHVKNEFTENEKFHNLMRWLKLCSILPENLKPLNCILLFLSAIEIRWELKRDLIYLHNVTFFDRQKLIYKDRRCILTISLGPRQANLLLIAYASSEGSGESAHPRSLARTFAARSYKQ